MTRIIILELIWDEVNKEHIKKHSVSTEEVENIGKNFIYHRKTHTGRYMAVGRSGNRLITIIIRRKAPKKYYPVTARDASKKERKDLYAKEKK
ncbi:MAG: hypothetical protein ACD_30C00005G0011 [uncultured bacterium]|uniref:BrnT family toxin n=3 Tax=Candidatus Daviesiibacteriota TaxID=1752718 RepID=A0A0G0H5Y6_9BACT|nr:MAG: hypothetical protein ACD_30C00005G0011 [uncultured bacterium]KKQ07494.1 MAG: hypothetical protein US19_C0044G0011 [Candidatus Daviesbacteria bacterium GW2011_GWB1_36_5]OGE16633.1 MAG: hypothetical protein A2858_02190 [Candidatus Daviesbacteria bacterium RIFCSPHIGHO2_01_FULL_36_37]OGE33371.1 MAG: hypothetical protein A3C99_01620 [Candidatus Daviesbacteria bacterium RIFCSPHIGHO2_02_FULL_37_9]OGE34716.1 MAG: hypothetical protein A3E66_03750 [Candidatus Daviesbacteria bacterium RIFCSPHIGHO2